MINFLDSWFSINSWLILISVELLQKGKSKSPKGRYLSILCFNSHLSFLLLMALLIQRCIIEKNLG